MDLVIGQQAANQVLMTAVDRASKYSILRLSPSKKAEDVTAVIIDAFLNLACIVLTMTYDNGKEFAYHEDITKALGALYFFATPYHSWERGLNEHTNGLIRQYFPKGMNFSILTPKMVQNVQDNLNHRPRKILGYRTPFEVFHNTEINLLSVAFGD